MNERTTHATHKEVIHANIEAGDLAKVKELICDYPKDSYVCNARRESAAATAIKAKEIDIYEYLISNQMHLAPHEDMNTLVDGYTSDDKQQIHEIHKALFNKPLPQHIINFMSRSMVSHDASKSLHIEHSKLIMDAYLELNEIHWVQSILQIVSSDSKIRIVHDFNHDTIQHLDPSATNRVRGRTYLKDSYIYIGSRGLKPHRNLSSEANENRRSAALGTLIHELCHYALFLLYKNNCQPYDKCNLRSQQEYEEIIRDCESKKHVDQLIGNVFNNYSMQARHAELIVRVPQIIVVYRNNYEQFSACEEAFERLFQFYEQHIVKDMTEKYQFLIAEQEVEKVNEICSTLVRLKSVELTLNPSSWV